MECSNTERTTLHAHTEEKTEVYYIRTLMAGYHVYHEVIRNSGFRWRRIRSTRSILNERQEIGQKERIRLSQENKTIQPREAPNRLHR